jgi:signal transduction histidine kinase
LNVPTDLQARESESATQNLVREWEATFRSLRDGLAVLDASARVVRVNPSFRVFLALPDAALIGAPFAEVLEQALGRAGRIAAEVALERPGRLATLRSGARWLELRLSRVEQSPRVGLGFVALLVDVTAKHELQRERARLRRRTREAAELRAEAHRLAGLEQMKTDLLNLFSHELRSPVTVVAGYLEMLDAGELGQLPPAARPILRTLRQQMGEMNILIGEILEVARLHQERVDLERRELELEGVVAGAVEESAAAFGTDRIRLRRAGGPCRVIGDAARLHSVVVSLIGNAVKFSEAAVEVTVEARPDAAIVVVRDHGIGIAVDDHEKIFQRLGRVVTRDNAHLPGTGLGLYSAREIARLHSGSLSVESVLGEGSTFTLTLPLVEGA